MIAKHPHHLGKRIVVGGDRAGLTERTEVLARVKTEAPRVADGARPPTTVLRPVRLTRILDDEEIVAARDFHDWVHVRHLAVQVYRHDRLRPPGDRRLKEAGVHRVGARIDVHEHRRRPAQADRLGCRHESVRHRDDLVAGAHSEAGQREPQRVRPVADPHRVAGAAEGREFALKLFNKRSAGEGVAIDHGADGGEQVGAQRIVLRAEVNEWYFHIWHGFGVEGDGRDCRRRWHPPARHA